MYADVITGSIQSAIEITKNRRQEQIFYNKKHGIIPKTIVKSIAPKKYDLKSIKHLGKSDVQKRIAELDANMHRAAEELNFEKAIELRDALKEMKRQLERLS